MFFVCIVICRFICIAPLVDRSKAKVLQGELAGEARLRGFLLFIFCIAPLVDRSKAQVIQGGAGGQSPTEGGLEWLPLPTKLDSRGNLRGSCIAPLAYKIEWGELADRRSD
ncbi:MAG: hypothetical protein CL920_10980 [Deltaproteobacteria bacterium]|nr:hypothetical protein [Deltaproteobacteria bacterium]